MTGLEELGIFLAGFRIRPDDKDVKFWMNVMLIVLIVRVWINNIVKGSMELKKKKQYREFLFGSVAVSCAGLLLAVYAAVAQVENISLQLFELMFACAFRYVNETIIALSSEVLPVRDTSAERLPAIANTSAVLLPVIVNTSAERPPEISNTSAVAEQLAVATTSAVPTVIAVASASRSKAITNTMRQAICSAITKASPKVGSLDIDTSSVPFFKAGRHVFDTRIYTFTAGDISSDAAISASSATWKMLCRLQQLRWKLLRRRHQHLRWKLLCHHQQLRWKMLCRLQQLRWKLLCHHQQLRWKLLCYQQFLLCCQQFLHCHQQLIPTPLRSSKYTR